MAVDCLNRFSKKVHLYYRKNNNNLIVTINKDLFIPYLFEKDKEDSEKKFKNIIEGIKKDNLNIFNNEEEIEKFVREKLKNLLALKGYFSTADLNDYEKLFALANIRFLTGGNAQNDLFNEHDSVKTMIKGFINEIDEKEISPVLNKTFINKVKANSDEIADILAYSFMFNNREEENQTIYEKTYENYQKLVIAIASKAREKEIAKNKQNTNTKGKKNAKNKQNENEIDIIPLLETITKKASLEFLNEINKDLVGNTNYNQKYQYMKGAYSIIVSNAIIQKDKQMQENDWKIYADEAISNLINTYTHNLLSNINNEKQINAIQTKINEKIKKINTGEFAIEVARKTGTNSITFSKQIQKNDGTITTEQNNVQQGRYEQPVIDVSEKVLGKLTEEIIEPLVKQTAGLLSEIKKSLDNINTTLQKYLSNPVQNALVDKSETQEDLQEAEVLTSEIQNPLQQETLQAVEALTDVLSEIDNKINEAITNGEQAQIVEEDIKAIEEKVQNLINQTKQEIIDEETQSNIEQLKKTLETYQSMFSPIIVEENDKELTNISDNRYYSYKGISYQRYTDVIERYFHFNHDSPVVYLQRVINNIDKITRNDGFRDIIDNILKKEYEKNQTEEKIKTHTLNAIKALLQKLKQDFTNSNETGKQKHDLIHIFSEAARKEYFDALLQKRNFNIDNVYDTKINNTDSIAERLNKEIKSIVEKINIKQGQASATELKETLQRIEELGTIAIKEFLSLPLKNYDYYTQRATIGRLTERAIQKKIKNLFDNQKNAADSGNKVTADSYIYNLIEDEQLTEDELNAILYSYHNISKFRKGYDFVKEIQGTKAYSDAKTNREKLANIEKAIQEVIEKTQEEKEKIIENNKNKIQIETTDKIDTNKKSPEELLDDKISMLETYKKELAETLNTLNKQYNSFAATLFNETNSVIEQWKNQGKQKEWQDVLKFNHKILNNVVYENNKSARLAGTPDILILKPGNKYTIYELKTYLNKSKDKQLQHSKTAKVKGYTLQDKATYQIAAYVSLLQGKISSSVHSKNIQSKIVFFGNTETKKEKEAQAEKEVLSDDAIVVEVGKLDQRISLFQRKILRNGVETFENSTQTLFTDDDPLDFQNSIKCNIALEDNHEKDVSKINVFDFYNIIKQLKENEGKLELSTQKSKHKLLYSDEEIEGRDLYFVSNSTNEKQLIGTVSDKNKDAEKIQQIIENEDYSSLSMYYSGLRYALKDDNDSTKQENKSMKIKDFMEEMLDNVAAYYGIEREKLEVQTEEEFLLNQDTGTSFINKNTNDIVVMYRMEDGEEGVNLVLAKQRIYKPRIEAKSRSAQDVISAIEQMQAMAAKYKQEITNQTKGNQANEATTQSTTEEQNSSSGISLSNLFYFLKKNKKKYNTDYNTLITNINTFKEFYLNNIQPLNEIASNLSGNSEEKNPIRKYGFFLRYQKSDYQINIDNIENNKLLEYIKDELSGRKNNKQITDFYEYESWYTTYTDNATGKRYINYNENGLVRISDFQKTNNGKLKLTPIALRITTNEKKKEIIDKEKRKRQKREYVINKASSLLSNFVEKKRGKIEGIKSIYKDPIGIADTISVPVPPYVVSIMEDVRNNFLLKEENFGVFQNNLAEIIYALEGLVYETRFGFTQEEGFINMPSDIKNFNVVFELVMSDIIGQIDTWALKEFTNDIDKLTKAKKELDILKYALQKVLEKRILSKQEKENAQKAEAEATSTTLLEKETTEEENNTEQEAEAVSAEEENIDEEINETKEEISTQQSIILGASSMSLEKNVNSILKNIIRYTTIKEKYELKDTNGKLHKIYTGENKGKYINFDVIYNSLPNFATKRYISANKFYYYPPNNIEDIKKNILSYLTNNINNNDHDFYLMLLAVYDKIFSDENKNSLLNKANSHEDLELLSNGLFNAFGSFTKTTYLFSDAEKNVIGIRNLTSFSQNDVKKLKDFLSEKEKIEAEFNNIRQSKGSDTDTVPAIFTSQKEAVNFIVQKTGINIQRANRIYVIAKRVIQAKKTIDSSTSNLTSEKITPDEVVLGLLDNGINESVTNSLSQLSDISESSSFKTIEGETRSDMGLRSTTIDDLQFLTTINVYSNAKANEKQQFDKNTVEQIKNLQQSPHFQYNELVKNGIVSYGDYLGIASKTNNIPYAKMDNEDIYFRFYTNVFKPLQEMKAKKSSASTIYINSFVSSNKKISFQVEVNHKMSAQEISGYNGSLEEFMQKNYEHKLKDMFYNSIMSELKARETLAKNNSKLIEKTEKIKFEFLSFVNKNGEKKQLEFTVKNENGKLELAEEQDKINETIKDHYSSLMKAQIDKAKNIISGKKYKDMSDMLDDEALFALAIGLHRVYKWDLDTYLYGFANMEYGSIDKANKRASIHTSVKYKVNSDFAFGIGDTFPVSMLKTPDKIMPEIMLLGYAETTGETEYKPFDGSSFVNPVFSELFSRATGKNFGFGLTQEGSHKPVAMWRDRNNLTNTSMKFASFDMFLPQIDTESFFEMKKLLFTMLSKKVALKKEFYENLTAKEEKFLDKINKRNDKNITDEELKRIPLSKINVPLIADYYQAINYYNHIIKTGGNEYNNPYQQKDRRHDIYKRLLESNKNNKKDLQNLFSDIIGICGDKEAFKNFAPQSISFYEQGNKSKDVKDILITENNIVHYPTKYFGFQLNPHHEIDKATETPLATQLLYLISLYSETNNSSDFNKETAKSIYKLLQSYIENINISEIIPYIKKDDNGEITIDYVTFYKKVYEKSNSDKAEMELFLNLVNKGQSPFAVPSIANKLISNITSIVEKQIVRLKTLGTDYVLVPDFYVSKTKYQTDKNNKPILTKEELKWHKLIYEVTSDITIDDIKFKKGEKINYSEQSESVKLKLVEAAKANKMKLISIGECELAMPVLDKKLLNDVINISKIINFTIKQNKLNIQSLPEFDVYGKEGGLDNPLIYLDLIKATIEKLKENGIDKIESKANAYPIDNVEKTLERFERMISPLGVRIPTTSKGNTIAGKVVKFLDTESNVVIFPSEIVKIHGSDYDVDKIKLFFKNYLDPNILSETSKKQHEITDAMIDGIKSILLHPENVYEFFTDIDFANAKNNIEIYSNALRTELVAKTIPYATLDGDAKLQMENMTNVYLVGIFATTAKFFSYAALSGLEIISRNEKFKFNLDLPKRERYIYKAEGDKLIKIPTNNNATYTKYVYSINSLSIATNAAIDAVKEQIHGAIGNNLFNARLYAFLLTQRNAFTTSAFFLSPFVYYNINNSFNEKKMKSFDKIFKHFISEARNSQQRHIMIEGEPLKEKDKGGEGGVISDNTLYTLLRKAPNVDEIDNFFNAIDYITEYINKIIGGDKNHSGIKTAVANALWKLTQQEEGTNLENSNILTTILLNDESGQIIKFKDKILESDNLTEIDTHLETVKNFIYKITEKIEVEYLTKDERKNEISPQRTVIELMSMLFVDYERMLASLNRNISKASSIFGINQGYKKDMEENIEKHEKALALLENKDDFIGTEKLFDKEYAGFFMSYYNKLVEGLKLIENITFFGSANYKDGYLEFLKHASYTLSKKNLPLTYRRAFAKMLNKIMLLPKETVRFGKNQYNFNESQDVDKFIEDFHNVFKNRDIRNMFYFPLSSITTYSNKEKLYLSFANYSSNLGTQNLIYKIYEKLKSIKDTNNGEAYRTFFDSLTEAETAYIKTFFKYTPDENTQNQEEAEKEWQRQTFDELVIQHTDATNMYYGIYLYDSLTNPNRGYMSVLNTLPSSIMGEIYNNISEKIKEFREWQEEDKTIFLRELFLDLKTKSIYEYEDANQEENNTFYSVGKIEYEGNTLQIISTTEKNPLPQAFNHVIYQDQSSPPIVDTYIQLTEEEARTLKLPLTHIEENKVIKQIHYIKVEKNKKGQGEDVLSNNSRYPYVLKVQKSTDANTDNTQTVLSILSYASDKFSNLSISQNMQEIFNQTKNCS